MPTQTIGKIKVVVNNQNTGSINVRQGNQFESKVNTISYGQINEIKRALDMNATNRVDGDAIVYKADTDSFEIGPITNIEPTNIFGGTF